MTEIIHYKSAIGILEITCSETSVHHIEFIEPREELKLSQLPEFSITKRCLTQIDDYFNGINLHFDLPVKQEGTIFQQKVWESLLTIQPGVTSSYLEMSRKLGNEKMIRALGAANGKNRIAIVVPCHRVIGSKGKLVGYAGGLWRKSWLLQHEAKCCNGVQTLF